MITSFSRALLAALLVPAAPFANAQSTRAPVPRAPLTTLVTLDDYPAQARAAGQVGTVRFRLDVDANGRVTGCMILRSASASILDASTCRLMRSRARFTPAHDAAGRAVAGTFEDEIGWGLPTVTAPPRFVELIRIYTACSIGEAARLAVSEMDIDAIADAAYARCASIEPLLLAEVARARRADMVPADVMRKLKLDLRSFLAAQVGAMRKNLATR